jgi:hypothetical protein
MVAYFLSWRSATADSRIRIEGNTVTGNSSEVSGGGIGAIATADANPPSDSQIPLPPPAFASANIDIERNLIANNGLTGFGAAGGGVFAFIQSFEDATSTIKVNRSTLADNTTDIGAGGIHVETFIGFDVAPGVALGQLEVSNSILADNQGVGIGGPVPAVEDGILAPGDQGTGNLSIAVAYSDVFGHPDGEYDVWVPDRTGVNGNLAEDPLLGAAWIPAECSPTIDTADPGLDFSAEPAPDGSRANMGHTGDTSAATPSLPDLNGDGIVDGIDMLRLSVSFGSDSADARYNSEADVNSDGSVDGDDLALVASDYGLSCD